MATTILLTALNGAERALGEGNIRDALRFIVVAKSQSRCAICSKGIVPYSKGIRPVDNGWVHTSCKMHHKTKAVYEARETAAMNQEYDEWIKRLS